MEIKMPKSTTVSESEFNKWRAIFALTHVDGYVHPDELRIMRDILNTLEFTADQRRILEEDMSQAKHIDDYFLEISDLQDRRNFFKFARLVAICDQDYDTTEQDTLARLLRLSTTKESLDEAKKNLAFQFEDENDDETQDNLKELVDTDKIETCRHERNKAYLLELFISRYEPDIKRKFEAMERLGHI